MVGSGWGNVAIGWRYFWWGYLDIVQGNRKANFAKFPPTFRAMLPTVRTTLYVADEFGGNVP